MDAFGFSQEELAGRNMAMVFGGALALIATINLEMLIDARPILPSAQAGDYHSLPGYCRF